MKKILITFCLLAGFKGMAQLKSGTPPVQNTTQPVPSASTTERSATPQPVINAPAANPIPPIVPGGDVKAVEIPRQLVYPPSKVSGTQPVQKEPLSPIESTNNLSPNRPQREENSRNNRVVSVPKKEINPSLNTTNVAVAAIPVNNKQTLKKTQPQKYKATKKIGNTPSSSKARISERL